MHTRDFQDHSHAGFQLADSAVERGTWGNLGREIEQNIWYSLLASSLIMQDFILHEDEESMHIVTQFILWISNPQTEAC